jgi:hypothetical protein
MDKLLEFKVESTTISKNLIQNYILTPTMQNNLKHVWDLIKVFILIKVKK